MLILINTRHNASGQNVATPPLGPTNKGMYLLACYYHVMYEYTYYIYMYVPDNLATKPPKMRDLLEQVASKVKDKWKLMGFSLNLEQDQLNTISQNCTDSASSGYSEVFSAWEKTQPMPFTWATIVEALESLIVGENNLARDIVKWLTR